MLRQQLLVWFLFLFCTSQVVWCYPFITSYSPTAYPGDVIRVTGEDFGQNPIVLIQSRRNENVTVSPLTYQNQTLTFTIPTNVSMDVYLLSVVTDSGDLTNQVRINQQIGKNYDMHHVNANSKFRIFGQNLYFYKAGLTPQVSFIAAGSTTALSATVIEDDSDPEILTVISPSDLVDNTLYDVQINNGYGYPSIVDQQIVGRSGYDIFGLGVGWGVDFAGYWNVTLQSQNNPALDDTGRIFQGLSGAPSNYSGSVVTLGPGHFYIRGGMEFFNGFVLRGSGVNVTFLHYGRNGTDNCFYSFGHDRMGISDMTVIHEGDVPSRFFQCIGTCTRMFQVRIHHQLGYCSYIELGGANVLYSDIVYGGPIFKTPAGAYPFNGFGFVGCSNYVWIRRCSIYYETSQGSFNTGYDLLIEDSSIVRSQRLQTLFPDKVYNFRGLSLNFQNGFTFLNNRMETIDADFYTATVLTNDGECLLTEAGGPIEYSGRGILSTATSTTSSSIIDTSQTFANLLADNQMNFWVGIVAGPGLSQVRRVVAGYANGTMIIDRPWSYTPVASQSTYSAMLITNNWLIKNNRFIGWSKGAPQLYQGRSMNVTTVGNHYLNCGGAYASPLLPVDEPNAGFYSCSVGSVTYPQTSTYFGINQEVFYYDNVFEVDNVNQSVQLGLIQGALNPSAKGFYSMMGIGLEMRNNTITRVRGLPNNSGYADGIFLEYCSYRTPNPVTFSGVIAQGNTLVNIPDHAYTITYNVGGAVVACANNQYLDTAANHTNIYVVCAGGAPPQLAELPNLCRSSNINWGRTREIDSSNYSSAASNLHSLVSLFLKLVSML